MTTFAQIDISGKVTLCFLTQLNKSVKKHGLFMVRLNSRPCRENIIIGILCNNKLTNIQYWKQKKPGQHDDKPFKEVVCKTIKDLRRWREDVARKKLVVLKPSRDEVCQKQFRDCIFWGKQIMPKTQLWSQMALTGAPRLVLHVSCSTLTSGGLLSPLNSILAFFCRFGRLFFNKAIFPKSIFTKVL